MGHPILYPDATKIPGTTVKNDKGQLMTLLEYRKFDDIDVQFESGYTSKNKQWGDFIRGRIQDQGIPSVHDIGIIGNVDHKVTKDHYYNLWVKLIQRCYCDNYPAYKFCGAEGYTMCDEWFVYEFFLRDMKVLPQPKGNKTRKLYLFIFDGKKEFNINNCALIGHEIFKRLSIKSLGFTRHKPSKSWRAYINVNRERFYLGYYQEKKEAKHAFDEKLLELVIKPEIEKGNLPKGFRRNGVR